MIEIDGISVSCDAVHPNTGDPCTLPEAHNLTNEVMVKQHCTERNLRWPELHSMDPAEGFNGRMPSKL